ncbi:MAG: hypothetical protein Q7W55_02310 [Pseudohongiella sp.]|nr:hypothetical protein [Pseudohongiella sp.]MDP2127759.1 hypothetical protein [Pseudohongiella sp.]
MLFCCMVFFLLYSALNNHKRPPDFNFEIVGTEQLGDRFLVFVDINNTGDSTAAELHIEMRLTSDAGDVESSVAVIDYLPASSTQRIGLYFSSDPALSQLEFRPMGYQEP